MHFPFFLEIEPLGHLGSVGTYVSAVEFLLDGLRTRGQCFVTAADFEDDLRDYGASPPRRRPRSVSESPRGAPDIRVDGLSDADGGS